MAKTTTKTSIKIAVIGLLAVLNFIVAASTFASILTSQDGQAVTAGQQKAAEQLHEAAARAAARGDFALAERLHAQAEEIGGPPCTVCE
jgi:uncharacterized protein HemY